MSSPAAPLDPTSGSISVVACAVATFLIAGVTVALRFVTRGAILRVVGLEDYFIAAALLFSLGNTIGMIFQAEYALGHHEEDVSLANVEAFLKAAFWTIISYNISLTLTKISILLLFLRIFGVAVRNAAWAVFAAVMIYGIYLLLTSIFYCVPVAAFWDLSITNKTCFEKGAKWFADAGVNIATDFAIFLLPLPVLRILKLNFTKKLGLYVVFALGFFVCIVSILRLYSVYIASISKDATWDQVHIAIWSSIELNTAIVCACLSTIKPLLAKLFPRLLSSTGSKNKTGDKTGYIRHSFGVDVRTEPATHSQFREGTRGGERRVAINDVELQDLEDS